MGLFEDGSLNSNRHHWWHVAIFSRVCHKHVTWRLEGISKKKQTFNPNSPDPKLFARKVHRKRLCKRDLRGPRVRFERWNGDGLLWYPCRLTIWLCYGLLMGCGQMHGLCKRGPSCQGLQTMDAQTSNKTHSSTVQHTKFPAPHHALSIGLDDF